MAPRPDESMGKWSFNLQRQLLQQSCTPRGCAAATMTSRSEKLGLVLPETETTVTFPEKTAIESNAARIRDTNCPLSARPSSTAKTPEEPELDERKAGQESRLRPGVPDKLSLVLYHGDLFFPVQALKHLATKGNFTGFIRFIQTPRTFCQHSRNRKLPQGLESTDKQEQEGTCTNRGANGDTDLRLYATL